MQDPAVLERLQNMVKSENFQEKMQAMAQNPKFMEAAGQYGEEMSEEIMKEMAEAKEKAEADDLGLGLDGSDSLDEDDEDDA